MPVRCVCLGIIAALFCSSALLRAGPSEEVDSRLRRDELCVERDGYRTVLVPVRFDPAVFDFVVPHCRVDVICTYMDHGTKVTTTFLRGVEVLAVNNEKPYPREIAGRASRRELTIVVKNAEVKRVVWAVEESGGINSIMLYKPGDPEKNKEIKRPDAP